MAYSLDDSWDNCTPVARAGNACFGLYVRCGIWSARNLTDGFVPGEIAAGYGSPEQARKLVDVGLWVVAEGGYQAPDYLARNPTGEMVRERKARAARRQALVRDPALREAVRRRDRDRCRYCGTSVRWTDRKGAKGGTYDHVDPDGPSTFDNLVVCCRACNAAKRGRTPEAAGMTLRDPDPNPDPTRNGSRSNPESSRPHSSSPFGGTDAGARGRPAPHPYRPDGPGCGDCNLPESHAVHQIRAVS